MSKVKKVVITGGPCSGKSTGMAHLKRTFEDRGFSVLIAPEPATYLFSGVGVQFGAEKLDSIAFQEALIAHQVFQEDNIDKIVSHYKGDVLVLLDRGILDSRAYMSDQDLQPIYTQNGINIDQVLSGDRYDGVIHLVTAANGAEKFYNLDNVARTETPQQARELDEKTKAAYKGFPKVQIIDNSTSFSEKIQRVEAAVSEILGIPQPIEKENKYLVRVKNWEKVKEMSKQVDISQYYLENIEAEERIRKRGIGNGATYYHTIKHEIPGTPDRIETEKIITSREFSLFSNRIQSKIEKNRYCFFHKNQYFELDEYKTVAENFDKNYAVLEIEVVKRDSEILLPVFLELVRDVTEDRSFRNYNLAVAV